MFKNILRSAPIVSEEKISKSYKFMYENFVISTQHYLYLLLRKDEEGIRCIKFASSIYKYGYPNDEVGHPLMEHGLGIYGFYHVENSAWIAEIRDQNRSHHRDSDSLHEGKKHYVARFKDVTLEVIATKYEEICLTQHELFAIIEQELDQL